jgi:hypothetical protein
MYVFFDFSVFGKKEKISHFLNKNTANKKVNFFLIDSHFSFWKKIKICLSLTKSRENKKNIPFFEYKKKSGELREFLNLKKQRGI